MKVSAPRASHLANSRVPLRHILPKLTQRLAERDQRLLPGGSFRVTLWQVGGRPRAVASLPDPRGFC